VRVSELTLQGFGPWLVTHMGFRWSFTRGPASDDPARFKGTLLVGYRSLADQNPTTTIRLSLGRMLRTARMHRSSIATIRISCNARLRDRSDFRLAEIRRIARNSLASTLIHRVIRASAGVLLRSLSGEIEGQRRTRASFAIWTRQFGDFLLRVDQSSLCSQVTHLDPLLINPRVNKEISSVICFYFHLLEASAKCQIQNCRLLVCLIILSGEFTSVENVRPSSISFLVFQICSLCGKFRANLRGKKESAIFGDDETTLILRALKRQATCVSVSFVARWVRERIADMVADLSDSVIDARSD